MSTAIQVNSNEKGQATTPAALPTPAGRNWNKARMITLQTLLVVSTLGVPIAGYYTHYFSPNKLVTVFDRQQSAWINLNPCRLLLASNFLTGCSTIAISSMLALGAKKSFQTLTAPITLLAGSFRRCSSR
ncbi:MAG TPA: hypothetical protein VLG44_08030 [Chlamydiales bacterium]|nr:hypothetical protein [Chlamydiales bacterium]